MASSRPSMATLSFGETTVRLYPSDTRMTRLPEDAFAASSSNFHELRLQPFSLMLLAQCFTSAHRRSDKRSAQPRQGRQHVYYLHPDETVIRTLTAPHPSSPVSRCPRLSQACVMRQCVHRARRSDDFLPFARVSRSVTVAYRAVSCHVWSLETRDWGQRP